MKKALMFLSVFMCCFVTAPTFAQGWGGSNSCDQPCPVPQQQPECAPAEKPMNDCYCLYCRYVPQYYNKTHCEYVPQVSYKKNCRMVPQYYEKTCCKMVPQYYTQTCCRQVPQYYYTCETKQVPKYTTERCCKYVPQYYYKHVSEPTCGDRCVETCR